VYAYDCPGSFKFTADLGPGEAVFYLPKRTARAERKRSASGVRYAGDGVTFHFKGDEAMLDADGRTHNGCIVDWKLTVWERARLSGVDYRAVGNEPGWYLEIYYGEKLVLVTDYGQKRYEFPAVEPQMDKIKRIAVYSASNENHTLLVTIEGKRCVDSMSGDPFRTSATVIIDGRVLRGCGQGLR
jgi:putative lipoprotein